MEEDPYIHTCLGITLLAHLLMPPTRTPETTPDVVAVASRQSVRLESGLGQLETTLTVQPFSGVSPAAKANHERG